MSKQTKEEREKLIRELSAGVLSLARDNILISLRFLDVALTDLKLLAYFSLLAMEQKCILPKQFEQISRMATDCQNLLGSWIISDKRRSGF